MSDNVKNIVYLSKDQYAELIENGAITVGGTTVTYSENDLYVTPQAEPVTDVKVNGTSIVANGIANVPVANAYKPGVVIVGSAGGLYLNPNNAVLQINYAPASLIKAGANNYQPITPGFQHQSAFYGLAKAAGDATQSASNNAVGIYTDEAQKAIAKMLGIPLWHRAELTQDDYDESLGMFILDVGNESEIRDVRVTGQAVWDDGFVAGSTFAVGFGNVRNRPTYTDFAVANNMPQNKRLYLGATGTCIYNTDTQRACFGYGFWNSSSHETHALHIDNYAYLTMQGRQTAVYHNFNHSRYFHIVAPAGVSWAQFAIEYTLM